MIYITGDMHGDKTRFKLIEKAGIRKNDTLIICGDFGFVWDNSKEEQKILKWIGKRNYNVVFVDGTNDNHQMLNSFKEVMWKGALAKKVSGNLYMLKRGEVYIIEEKTVFALGGGTPLDDMTPLEADLALPDDSEIERAKERLLSNRNKVDIIITHDAPRKLRQFLNLERGDVTKLHNLLEEISAEIDFKQWYFGRYHIDKIVPPCYNAVFTNVLKYEER